MVKIAFLGNFSVDYSSESHHAKSLEALGNEVYRMQEGQTGWDRVVERVRGCDVFVHVHTHGWREPGGMSFETAIAKIKDAGIPYITYHLDLWFGLQREKDLENDPFYKSLDYFFATDKLMCDWFNENTSVKGRYLPAGVYHEECYLHDSEPLLGDIDLSGNEVIFVGSKGYHSEWPYRPKLIDWLTDTYGSRFTHVGGDGMGTTRGAALNYVYANSKIAVGDSLVLNFDYPYYWSDRVYETMGRGGFLIMPYIKGLDEQFEDGKHLVFYEFNDFTDLKNKIDFYLENDPIRERIRLQGHEEVKAKHTYKHRWQYILNEILKGRNR